MSAIFDVVADVNHLVPYSRHCVAVELRDGLALRDVGAAGALGHPLAARPHRRRIARREQRDVADRSSALVAAREQRARRAVGHRERARVDVERRAEHVDDRELMRARVRAEPRLVAGRDHAVPRGEHLRLAPQRRDLDPIDAIAPRIPLGQHRLVLAIGELLAVVLDREVAELRAARSRSRRVRLRNVPRDPRRQQRIVVELVAETRWLLEERHGGNLPR